MRLSCSGSQRGIWSIVDCGDGLEEYTRFTCSQSASSHGWAIAHGPSCRHSVSLAHGIFHVEEPKSVIE